jgi:hypothetical protein
MANMANFITVHDYMQTHDNNDTVKTHENLITKTHWVALKVNKSTGAWTTNTAGTNTVTGLDETIVVNSVFYHHNDVRMFVLAKSVFDNWQIRNIRDD